MGIALDQVTKDALNLPPRQKLALAELLTESVDSSGYTDAEAAWESEIEARIRAIDEGKVPGGSFEEVMRSALQKMGSPSPRADLLVIRSGDIVELTTRT